MLGLLASMALAATISPAGAAPTEPIGSGSRLELLVDDFVVDDVWFRRRHGT